LFVIFALLFYTLGIFSERRTRTVTPFVLGCLSFGVLADLIATALMILGSSKEIFSLHGIIGYSALSGMLIDNVLIWRIRFKHGLGVSMPRWLHIYSHIVYVGWIMAFISGGILAYFSSVGAAKI
jgi:hypothetical protein